MTVREALGQRASLITVLTAQITQLQQLYDRDYYLWLEVTTKLLKSRQLEQLDLDNLIEEIETLGRSEKNRVISSLKLICQHLLKWQYQSQKRSKSWSNTIRRERNNIADLVEDIPSLKRLLETPEALAKAYRRGRNAIQETEIEDFPQDCPFSLEEILDHDYLPSSEGS